MIAAILLLSVASAFPTKDQVLCRPVVGDAALQYCFVGFKPQDVGADSGCPAFTHLHAFLPPPANTAEGSIEMDGLCHRDDNDAAYIPPPSEDEIRAWR
jgi:hypothetical protein